MRLNRTSGYVLLHLINGIQSSMAVSQHMPQVHIRSIQRALVNLTTANLIERCGVNNPQYNLNYKVLLSHPIREQMLEDIHRPQTCFNFHLLDWLISQSSQNLSNILSLDKVSTRTLPPMTVKEIEQLDIELAWKLSALEGNTYTLLETELLLTRGIRAKNKTNFETQMVENHSQALRFILNSPSLFKDKLLFSTLEELHKRIVYNLDINSGIRKKTVKITASNYQPIEIPLQLRQSVDLTLKIINNQQNPIVKALLALSLIAYLQAFEDGNKRLGRLLANALLIHSIGRGFTLKTVDEKQLAIAYLAFYEFNSLHALAIIFKNELLN